MDANQIRALAEEFEAERAGLTIDLVDFAQALLAKLTQQSPEFDEQAFDEWFSENHFDSNGEEISCPSHTDAARWAWSRAGEYWSAKVAELELTLNYRDEDIPVLRQTIANEREKITQLEAEVEALNKMLRHYER